MKMRYELRSEFELRLNCAENKNESLKGFMTQEERLIEYLITKDIKIIQDDK